MLAEEARKQPRVAVVAAAGTVADDQVDPLAAIEVGDRFGTDRGGREGRNRERQQQDAKHEHGGLRSARL